MGAFGAIMGTDKRRVKVRFLDNRIKNTSVVGWFLTVGASPFLAILGIDEIAVRTHPATLKKN